MDMLQAMRAVTEVAHLGSFTAAGRAMKMSTPSISRLVGELEADLGVRLFNRTTRQVALTPEGQDFLQRGDAILQEINALRDVTQERHQLPSGKLVVSSALAFGNEMLAPSIPEFLSRYPSVSVELNLGSRTVDLVAEHIDVALRIGVGGLPDSSLTAVKIHDYKLIFVASRDYVDNHGAPKILDDLQQHRMVKLSTGSWGHVQTLRTPEGLIDFRLPESYGVDSYRGQLRATLAGYGCALMHDIVAQPEIDTGQLVRVLPDCETIEQSIYAVYVHRTFLAARIRVFIDFMMETFGNRTLGEI